MTEKKRALTTTTKSYELALAIRTRGPQTKAAAMLLADLGHTPTLQRKRLEVAMKSGWLVEIGDLVHLSEYALKYFDGSEPEPEAPKAPTGSLATPRENVNVMMALSSKYFINSKGLRSEAPDCSVLAWPSTYSKG